MNTNCTSCNSNNNIVYYPVNNSQCSVTTDSSCSTILDTACVKYTGSNLSSINVLSNSNLEDILITINTKFSEITGINWDQFDYSCLDASEAITTAQEFAEAISAYVCELNTEFETFSTSTFTDAITAINSSIEAIEEPNITSCSAVGILSTDTYSQVLTKLSTALCSTITAIDPSGANWSTFSVVSPEPTNVTDAFNIVIDWVNDLVTNPAEPTLPEFNTIGTCLPTPSANDTLYNTVVKLINKICELPELDIDELLWQSCIANPNEGGGADLESVLNTLIQKLNEVYSLRITEFDSDFFETSYNTSGDTCTGTIVTLRNDIGLSDELVALDNSDTSPGFLLDKITAGSNISFDTVTAPGTVIIDCDAEDNKVKADSGDTVSDYLINKIAGKSDGDSAITLSESYNATTDKVDITPSFDWNIMAQKVMEAISSNNDRLTEFCALSCGCQPCIAGEERTITVIVTTVDGSADTEYSITVDQSSPTLAMYNSGNVIASSGTVLTSGAYTVTSASIPVNGVLTINNNNSGAALPYDIYVIDGSGDPVSGSTTQTGSIPLSDSLTINPFTFGSTEEMIVHIDLGTGLTTTSTTTTTTTGA